MAFITLLTDFGHSDEYVGVMKGVIFSIDPEANIIDLTHHIDPQDISQAAYLLKAAYPYFPKNSIHVVVVDPGVGTDRKIVALKIDGHVFLAPDNGVLSILWENHPIELAVCINNSQYFLKDVSMTFHGRDIFAPVAAWLSRSTSITSLGPPIEYSDLKKIKFSDLEVSQENTIIGRVISIDRFGNLLTNIDEKTFFQLYAKHPNKHPIAKVGEIIIKRLSTSYQSVAEKEPLMIIGSRGYLEIAINCGNASKALNISKGDTLLIDMASS